MFCVREGICFEVDGGLGERGDKEEVGGQEL